MSANAIAAWNAGLQNDLQSLWIDIREGEGLARDKITHELRQRGFAMVRGLGAEGDVAAFRSAYRRFGDSLGTVMPQNLAGSMLEDICNYSDLDTFDNRGYRSGGELSMHTDPPTLLTLYCVRPAKSGGANHLASIEAIHREIEARRPDLLPELYAPFRYWEPSEAAAGEGAVSSWSRPVFMRQDGRISCLYYRPYIELAANASGVPLTARQVEAFDCFDAVANDPRFLVTVQLEAGDCLVLHNRAVMHARTDYEDWPERERRRHLLRLWIDAPDIRPAPAAHCIGDYFSSSGASAIANAGARGSAEARG